MMTSTLTMVIGVGVALAFASVGIVLAALLIWQGRRIGDSSLVRQDLDTLRKEHRNLDELFESYRKRDAGRASADIRKTKKQEAEVESSAQTTPIASRDDIVRAFENMRQQN